MFITYLLAITAWENFQLSVVIIYHLIIWHSFEFSWNRSSVGWCDFLMLWKPIDIFVHSSWSTLLRDWSKWFGSNQIRFNIHNKWFLIREASILTSSWFQFDWGQWKVACLWCIRFSLHAIIYISYRQTIIWSDHFLAVS